MGVEKMIQYGARKQTLSQWAAELGMSKQTLLWRIQKGWPLRAAFRIPVRKKRRSEREKAIDGARG